MIIPTLHPKLKQNLILFFKNGLTTHKYLKGHGLFFDLFSGAEFMKKRDKWQNSTKIRDCCSGCHCMHFHESPLKYLQKY
jgi:hypothetical protein